MYYDRAESRIILSVRELCGMALAGGSIDNRYPSHAFFRRADEGREVHGRLRKLRERGEGLGRGEGFPGRTEDLLAPHPRESGSENGSCSASNASHAAYYPELPLRHVAKCDDVTFSVGGRADGVWYDPDGGCVVEEIKSVPGPAELYVRAPREQDLAQLTCYGYFLCAAKGLSSVTLRLTYAHAGDEDHAVHTDSVLTVEHLREAYIALLRMILPRARDLIERETTVRDAAKAALFPYPDMRDAQKDMILECWRDMRAGKTLFAQAPTGIGKTIATLYPAVRTLGENRCDKIFYLTAKNATRREAFAAAEKLVETGTPIRTCVITARDSACSCEAAREARKEGRRTSAFCNPTACPFAKGYYDRVESVIEGMLASGKKLFSGLDIRAAAEEGRICPYELALDLSERCEVVICDYNYVFSPAVSLRRYFSDGIPGTEGHRYIFLVDEAHNLPDRARDMYSASLSLDEIRAAQNAIHAWETQAGQSIFPEEDYGVGNLPDEEDDIRGGGKHPPRLTSATLDDLVGTLSRMSLRCAETMAAGSDGVRHGGALDHAEPVELAEAVYTVVNRLDRWLHANLAHPLYPVVDGLAGTLKAFRTAADYYDRRFVTFTEAHEYPDNDENDVRVRLLCLDPAEILRPILQKAVARVLFSATLTPTDYFADILGGDRTSVTVAFDSPFPTDHLCIAVCDQINTRFESREESYRRIVSYISAVVSARRGNYIVYFPSYDYLDEVYKRFAEKYPSLKTVVQMPGMSYAEREAFIAAFTPDSKELLVGFCVLGGSFSEGVDLPGRCLIGTIIVGVGIPGLSNERNIMRDYYGERAALTEEAGMGDGYAYAYTYPGMNRVLQAAGRVIRRAEDYGVVVLMDDRYAAEPYLSLYPDHWTNMVSVEDASSLFDYLSLFWSEVKAAGG